MTVPKSYRLSKCFLFFKGNRIRSLMEFMLKHKGTGYEVSFLSKKFSLQETTLFHTSGMNRNPVVKEKGVKFARASINGKCILYVIPIKETRGWRKGGM